MKQILQKATIEINRRRFLRTTATATFGALAAVGIGSATPVQAAPCTGPNGTGRCASSFCSGSNCKSTADNYCHKVNYCGGSSCWRSSSGGTCCDCLCQGFHTSFYCYCYG